jgi:hypothetical protein
VISAQILSLLSVRNLSLQEIRAAAPVAGFFKDKQWRLSPVPFRLSRKVFEQLNELGPLLEKFISACDSLYQDSRSGVSERWVSRLLDRGKPDAVLELGILPSAHGEFAHVVRPDILLTPDGLALSEIDSTPGGIGLTAWLSQLYGRAGWDVIGSPAGMLEGFRGILGGGRVIFSQEALDYRPEIEWIVSQIHPDWRDRELIVNEWEFDEARHFANRYYRYFELWDFDNISNIHKFVRFVKTSVSSFTAPMKAYLEEKLWLALLWTPGLKREWTDRLGPDAFDKLKAIVPTGWVMDPEPIPHHSVYPGLNIQNWMELGEFSQKERQLVLKISGFSERAWGSRGVTIAHDISSVAWKGVVQEALVDYKNNPRVLQRFHSTAVVEHPYYVNETGQLATMQGRVRLCPYYFRSGTSIELKGVLATICPREKKIIHGMRDAIMVPCVVD